MRTQLATGIVDYCGIKDAPLELFYERLEDDEIRVALLASALQLGRSF